jgi:GH43 family beta-xylosidase
MADKIICISGLINSGKDTAAEYLINNHNFTKLSFAGTLKDTISVLFNWDRTLLEGETLESRQWREQVDSWWAKRLDMPHLTPRWVLQFWGTEVCRVGFHKDIWVAALENKLSITEGNVVITDARFSNELKAIKDLNGTLVRVERGSRPIWYENARLFNIFNDTLNLDILKKHNVHASEYSSIGLKYDHLIDNNQTKQDLFAQVESIINL